MSFIKKLLGIGSDETPQAASANGGGSRELPVGHEQFVVCKYCQRKVKKGVRHQCQPMRDQRRPARYASEDEDDFFVSFLIAYTTDSWALGYMGGGNLMGSILGDALREDGFEEDIPADAVMEIDPDEAFVEQPDDELATSDPEAVDEAPTDDPVIAIDPEEQPESAPAPEEPSVPVDTGPDADDTTGDSGDSY